MKKHSVMRWALAFGSVVICSNAFASIPSKVSAFPEGERLIYTRLIEAYHHNQLDEVVKQRLVLERNYPHSIHLDNAYYLNGMVELQNNRLGEALKSFDVVRDHYVKSNKRSAALFATAATYQRLNLPVQAHRVYQRIMNEYPGSPESQRAWMQLRVEKEVAKKPSLKR